MYVITDALQFPNTSLANDDGLLAIGGNLSTELLLMAYKSGIFPWYNNDEPIMWWSPNPRCVLYPKNIVISKSMHTVLQNGNFRFTINKAFLQVIQQCQQINNAKHQGTWINDDIIKAYHLLHLQGHAHSAEAWHNGKLVGGLYGVKIGHVFFGESMFSTQSNASKFAFIKYVQFLQKENVELIDCQIHSPHLQSLGATLIDRNMFINKLASLC
jgi:leucyl/phenylalanyl-tRNA---protein transferase